MQTKYFTVRDYSEKNKIAFKQKLQSINWDCVLTLNNPAESFEKFHQIFFKIYTECFPEKRIKSGYNTRKSYSLTVLQTFL